MACTSGCPTQDHRSWGECMRSKKVRTSALMQGWKGGDRSTQNKWDRDLDAFEAAVKQGITPRSTHRADTDFAVRKSNETGEAYAA